MGKYKCILIHMVFLLTPVLHCSVNAVFCSYSDALWWLQWGTTLLPLVFLCRPGAPAVLGGSALQGRVAGVGVVGVLAQRAGPGAEDEPRSGEEGASQERQPAAGAAETRLHGVPVLTLVRHLTLVDTWEEMTSWLHTPLISVWVHTVHLDFSMSDIF